MHEREGEERYSIEARHVSPHVTEGPKYNLNGNNDTAMQWHSTVTFQRPAYLIKWWNPIQHCNYTYCTMRFRISFFISKLGYAGIITHKWPANNNVYILIKFKFGRT